MERDRKRRSQYCRADNTIKQGENMNKKTKAKISVSTILLTATLSYLTAFWVKQSGIETVILNKLDDIKDIIKGEKQ